MYIVDKDVFISEIPRTGSSTMVHYFEKTYRTEMQGHFTIGTALWAMKRIPTKTYAIIREPVDRIVGCINQNYRMMEGDPSTKLDKIMSSLVHNIRNKLFMPELFMRQKDYVDVEDVVLVPFDNYSNFMGFFGFSEPRDVFREEKPVSEQEITNHKLWREVVAFYEQDFLLYNAAKEKGNFA